MTQSNNRHIQWGRYLSILLMIANILVCLSAQVFAAEATTIWDKANEIMKDVYNQILLIFYHRCHCYCVHRIIDDELFKVWTHG